MLLFHESRELYRELSPTEIQAIIEKFNAWRRGLTQEDRFIEGKKLATGGRVLRRTSPEIAGNSTEPDRIIDGPFSESKEILGGFFVIRADSYEHAIRLCHAAPAEAGAIEVREIESG